MRGLWYCYGVFTAEFSGRHSNEGGLPVSHPSSENLPRKTMTTYADQFAPLDQDLALSGSPAATDRGLSHRRQRYVASS
jgi:hypothetical protein